MLRNAAMPGPLTPRHKCTVCGDDDFFLDVVLVFTPLAARVLETSVDGLTNVVEWRLQWLPCCLQGVSSAYTTLAYNARRQCVGRSA